MSNKQFPKYINTIFMFYKFMNVICKHNENGLPWLLQEKNGKYMITSHMTIYRHAKG